VIVSLLVAIIVGIALAIILDYNKVHHKEEPFTAKSKHIDKDPDDYSKTDESTDWEHSDYCNACHGGVSARNILDRWCPHCGERINFDTHKYGEYTFRKILIKGVWKYQYRNLIGTCMSQVRDNPLKGVKK
jgi:hypothetical protein